MAYGSRANRLFPPAGGRIGKKVQACDQQFVQRHCNSELLDARKKPFVLATGYGTHAMLGLFRDRPLLTKPFPIEALQKCFDGLIGEAPIGSNSPGGALLVKKKVCTRRNDQDACALRGVVPRLALRKSWGKL
jgi:hypothetical protein